MSLTSFCAEKAGMSAQETRELLRGRPGPQAEHIVKYSTLPYFL